LPFAIPASAWDDTTGTATAKIAAVATEDFNIVLNFTYISPSKQLFL
jgi:hypothetical protein